MENNPKQHPCNSKGLGSISNEKKKGKRNYDLMTHIACLYH